MTGVEERIGEWRAWLGRRPALTDADIDELESHLRDQIGALTARGLDEDEALLIAVRRMGSVDELAREYAVEHSDRLWKQLTRQPEPEGGRWPDRALLLALACGVGAGLAVKIGLLTLDENLLTRVVGLLVLPFLALYFLLRRRASWRLGATLAGAFAVLALPLALYPFDEGGMTWPLAALHAPVAGWLISGVAYASGRWRSRRARMDLVRFTGEWAVYLVLVALGGMALVAITVASFASLDVDVDAVVGEWILPWCVPGAVVVCAWLVEAKQSVVENMAPVLAKVLTVPTVLMLAAVLAAFATHPDVLGVERDLLVVMAAILVLVLALFLYSLSARSPEAPAGVFDWLQLALLLLALAVDAVVLTAMGARIAEFGLTANKAVALGLNVVLLVDLLRSAWLLWEAVRGRRPMAALVDWQAAFLPVLGLWAACVVVVVPVVFAFA